MTINRPRIVLVSALAAAVMLSMLFLTPTEMVSEYPVYTDDYSMHLSQCHAAQHWYRAFGRCWGYDPYMLAGFPRCVLVNADNKAWELLCMVAAPLVGMGRAFKLYIFVILMLHPLLIYAAARNLGLRSVESACASVLGLLFFYLSLPRDLVLWGMTSYVFMCYCSLYVFSVLYRLFEQFTLRRYCWLALLASLLFLMHILAPVHLFVPALCLYVWRARRLSLRQHLLVLLLPLVVFLANSFWLLPIAQFFHYKTARPENYEFTMQISNIGELLNVYVKQRRSYQLCAPVLNNTLLEVVLLIAGSFGLVQLWRRQRTGLVAATATGVIFIGGVAYFGSHTAFFAQFQPQRFVIPLGLLFVPAAAVGLCRIAAGCRMPRSWCVRAVIMLLVAAILYTPLLFPLAVMTKNGLYRLQSRMPEQVGQLLQVLEDHTDVSGRILIEDSESVDGRPEAFYGGHYPALFPLQLKRHYLCGPRPLYPIIHSYASFTEGVLFERPIEEYGLQEMQLMFDSYNVKWIVAWHEPSKRRFEQFPDYIRQIARVDKFTVYEVVREPSFFLRGSGIMEVDANEIRLRALKADNGSVVLSLHWLETLHADGDARIRRVDAAGDPVGFIAVETDAPEVTIRNRYAAWW